jgi:hypothetical protein
MARRVEPPTPEEGFSRIVIVRTSAKKRVAGRSRVKV